MPLGHHPGSAMRLEAEPRLKLNHSTGKTVRCVAELPTIDDVGLRGCRNQRREVQNIEHVEKVSPDPKFGSVTQKSGVRQPEIFAEGHIR
jgi:hypothetical protein